MPSGSNPDALRKKREGLKKDTKLSSTAMWTWPSQWGGCLCKRATSSKRKRRGAQEQGPPRPAKSRETFPERPTSLSQTWILDRSMAATGGEEAGRGSLWIRITLDSSGRGGQRREKRGRRRDGGKKRKGSIQGQPQWW